MATALPSDLRHLRKPTTTNASDWWYHSDAVWDAALAKAQSRDPLIRKSGRQTLVRGNHAGRIMETDEGTAAVGDCYWCNRPGSQEVCRIYADGRSPTCGYCLGKGKNGCAAGVKVGDVAKRDGSADERLVQRVERLEEEQAELKKMVEVFGQQFKANVSRVAALEEHLARPSAPVS